MLLGCIFVGFNGSAFLAMVASCSKVGSFSEEEKEKIESMSSSDLSISERRMWYNALARRFKHPARLKPGLGPQ